MAKLIELWHKDWWSPAQLVHGILVMLSVSFMDPDKECFKQNDMDGRVALFLMERLVRRRTPSSTSGKNTFFWCGCAHPPLRMFFKKDNASRFSLLIHLLWKNNRVEHDKRAKEWANKHGWTLEKYEKEYLVID